MQYRDEIMQRMKNISWNEIFVYDSINDKKYTYHDIFNSARKISCYLEEKKIEMVYVYLKNSIDLFIMYFACMRTEIIISPIDIEKPIEEFAKRAKMDKLCYLFISEEEIDDVKFILKEELFEKTKSNYNDVDNRKYIEEIELDKLYLITYTSGTTGLTKGVKHTLFNLFSSAIAFGTSMGYNEKSILCHNMPMSYMAGILNTILMPFIMGSKIVIAERFSVVSAFSFWKTVMKYQINTFWMSPTMLHVLLKLKPSKEILEYFENNKVIFSVGTAPLHLKLKEEFEEKFGVVLYQSYGLSETLFLTSALPKKNGEKTSVGYCIEDVSIKMGEENEILVHVPWMFKGYTNVETEEYFQQEFYKTGDLGKVINEELYITGRKKELIIRGGLKISPMQIEKIILEEERVKECFVGSYVFREEEKIFCCYVSETEKLELQLNETIAKKAGKNFKIDKFLKLKTIPKNLNGKNDKEQVIKLIQGGKNDIKA